VTFIVESARNALFRNEWPNSIGWLVYFVLAAFVMWLGWAWFEKTKKGFADVL
jgi:lipopolysaccharide transport system permease protein